MTPDAFGSTSAALIALVILAVSVGCTPATLQDAGMDVTDAACVLGDDTPHPAVRCPATPPQEGSACADGLRCTWGTDPSVYCRQTLFCECGRWRAPVLRYPCVPGASGCPADSADAGPALCTTDGDGGFPGLPPGAVCPYTDGTRCACGNPFFYRWQCVRPADACPREMPNAGADCTTNGADCDYGDCYQSGMRLQCVEGSWRMIVRACPG